MKEQSSTLVDFLTEFAMSLEVWRRSRSPGRIFGTQRFPRGRDPILSTQTFRAAGVFRLGAMSRKLAIFKKGNYVDMVQFFTSLLILCAGDLDEMIDCQRGKHLLQGFKKLGAI